MITRRRFLLGAGALAASGFSLGAYAGAIEPMLRLLVTDYALTPPGWPADFELTIAVLADIHAIDPWMTPRRISPSRCIPTFSITRAEPMFSLSQIAQTR